MSLLHAIKIELYFKLYRLSLHEIDATFLLRVQEQPALEIEGDFELGLQIIDRIIFDDGD
jgi:hypothetical protein